MGNKLNFQQCYLESSVILMEGAIGTRLKGEYGIPYDEHVALAAHIYNENSRNVLKELRTQYIQIAEKHNLPIMLTTETRKANKERVDQSIYNEKIIGDNVSFLKEIRKESSVPVYIGGLMGCKNDAYKSDQGLEREEAIEFHSWQANLFREAGADYLYAAIMPTLPEAIGMAQSMEKTGLPYTISFMIGRDGRLLDGTSIHEAIRVIDEETNRNPFCYMTNCVHPNVVYEALSQNCNRTDMVKERFKGIQANAANLTPEELEKSTQVISSDASSLAGDMLKLRDEFDFKIFGGCCGTNDSHIEELAVAIIE